MFLLRASLVLAGLLAPIPLSAQAPATGSLRHFLPDDGTTYAPEAPEPEAFFRFPIGEWHLRHHELLAYYRALAAAAPDRVLLEEIGASIGRRTRILITIASPANLARLEAIRTANLQNALGAKAAPADAPAVVWLGYSIHGNEPSGANAGPIVAYHLAAGRGPAVDALLADTVVLIDPFINPDGIDRFADWTNNARGRIPNPDPENRDHDEPAPSGRTNYYWHDLNRDWLPATMPESRSTLATYHRWRPAVVCDFHEMSASESYFFQPGIPEMVNPLLPEGNQELTARIATHHARALDAIGALYFTGERYDDFYAGKGSTYPDLNGSVGILFEQASARGHSRESDFGTLTMRFGVRNQVRTSLSSLEGARENRADLLAHQHRSALSSRRGDGGPKGWVFAAPGDPVRLAKFEELLDVHHVEHRRLARDLEAAGATYRAGEAVVVATAQPAGRLATAMFERRTAFQSNAFYDVSAWNMAEAYGLKWTPLEALPPAASLARAPAGAVTGRVGAGAGGVALAFSWGNHLAPRAAWRFLEAGARVRVALAPFTAATTGGPVAFAGGTLLVPLGIQDLETARLEAIAARIAADDGIDVHRITSGLTPEGIDIGSPTTRPVRRPSIALAVGEGANSYLAGDVWHVLDREIGIPVSVVDNARLTAANLPRYTAVVFSDGRFRATESLKSWVEAGGTLILTGAAIHGLVEAKWAPVELLRADFPRERVPFATARENAALRLIAGSIVEAAIDPTHPAGFGYPDGRIALMRNRDLVLKPSTNPFSSPALYSEKPLVAGFIGEPHLKQLAGSAAVQVHHLRAGRIVLLPDAPTFRSHWHGSSRLLFNAIFFGDHMRENTGRVDDAGDEHTH